MLSQMIGTVPVKRVLVRSLMAGIFCLAGAAARAEAVALVEDIGEPRPGVQFMDYLNAGQMIPLHPGEQMVIDYLHSCVRETIVGGVVSIGNEKSVVIGGKVTSETVECDGGKANLTPQQASKSGVMVFRGGLLKDAASSTAAQQTLYGTSPLFDLTGGGRLVIERLDKPGEKHVADIAGGSRRTLFDCAKQGCELTPGGVYRASAGGREITFKVADTAKPGAAPVVGRLLHL